MKDYYVYVYIDPRNLEEFYYGKGTGSRKDAHLFDESDSEKASRIKDIKKEGLEPIIRVVARNLSSEEALLIEKTLLWKLGKQLTNISSGHYSEKFRPHNKIHLELSGFDYQNGIYYYNVGECEYRNWDDYVKYNIISAGHGIKYREAIRGLKKGDIFAAYLKGHGFVGIGKIVEEAKPISEVIINGAPLISCDLSAPEMLEDSNSKELCEYVALVEWMAAVDRNEAKWKRPNKNPKLFTTTHVRASLDGQPDTVAFLEEEFGIQMKII